MIQRHHGIGKDSQKTAGNGELSAHDGGDKLLPTLWTGSLTSFVLREASPDDVTAGDMLLIGGFLGAICLVLSRGDLSAFRHQPRSEAMLAISENTKTAYQTLRRCPIGVLLSLGRRVQIAYKRTWCRREWVTR